jgi:alkylation response protein AidB-like acyl-CoA dehydrogenase
MNMSAASIKTGTAGRLLADVRELAADIASRAEEIEAGRRIPLDLVEALKSIGVFRMFVPRSHGGSELDLPAGLEIIGALGRLDGSVGWIAMIGSTLAMFASLLPRETYDQIYRDGPDAIIAGSGQPPGTAEASSEGWRVTGRWPFASGCQHADWIFGFCITTWDGQPLPRPAKRAPLVRGFFLPARRWQIEDSWDAAGLRGTGSHHIALRDALVPAANFFDPAGGTPCVPGPLYSDSAPIHFAPLALGAINVGIAEGALGELVKIAETRRWQPGATPMPDSEMFRGELGRIETELRAARALLRFQAASHWGHALAGTLRDKAVVTEGMQAAAWIAATCVRAANACFALGGASALYESSPLQRRLRDSLAAAQHTAMQQRNYVDAGALLVGKPVAGGAPGSSAPCIAQAFTPLNGRLDASGSNRSG